MCISDRHSDLSVPGDTLHPWDAFWYKIPRSATLACLFVIGPLCQLDYFGHLFSCSNIAFILNYAGPAKDTLVQLAGEKQSFDVVFIDANKDGYLEYYKVI